MEQYFEMTNRRRIFINCSEIFGTPHGMGLYTIELVRALSSKSSLLLVFKSNFYNRHICKSLGLSDHALFIPLPQIIIEQLIIPIVIFFYRVSVHIFFGNTVSLCGCRICRTYLLLHNMYFSKKIDLEKYSFKRRLARIYRYLTISTSIRKCKKVITVSTYMKEQIAQR